MVQLGYYSAANPPYFGGLAMELLPGANARVDEAKGVFRSSNDPRLRRKDSGRYPLFNYGEGA